MSWKLVNTIRLRSQNRFAALEDLNDSEDIGLNGALENINENDKTSPKVSLVCTNSSSINHGLNKNMYDV